MEKVAEWVRYCQQIQRGPVQTPLGPGLSLGPQT